MRKEFLDMRVRFSLTFLIMLVLFISLMLMKDWAVETLEKHEITLKRYVGGDFIQKLKRWDFYIYTQWYGKNFGELVPIIGIIFAFPLFSREFENRTVEFLLTRGKRPVVFMNKILVSSGLLVATIIILCLVPILMELIPGVNLNMRYIAGFTLHATVGALLWYSTTVLFSVMSNDQVKPLLFSLGILVLTSVLGMLKALRWLNTYLYIMTPTGMHSLGIAYMLSSIILVYASWMIFKRKEF